MKMFLSFLLSCALILSLSCYSAFADGSSLENSIVSEYLSEASFSVKENRFGSPSVSCTGIKEITDKLLERGEDPVEVGKAVLTVLYDKEFAENAPEYKVLDALNYDQMVSDENIIRVHADGTGEIVTPQEANRCIELDNSLSPESCLYPATLNSIVSQQIETMASSGSTTSSDGYMRLQTKGVSTSNPSSYSSRKYFIVSVKSNWLKIPKNFYEDVLALSWAANYDSTYQNYAYTKEEETCTKCSHHVTKRWAAYKFTSGTKYNASDAPDHIQFDYSPGYGGLACRTTFKSILSGCPHDTGSSGNYYLDHSKISVMETYLESRVFVDGTATSFGLSSAYSHKHVSLGSIGVSIGASSGGLSGGISFSCSWSHTNYYADAITVDV